MIAANLSFLGTLQNTDASTGSSRRPPAYHNQHFFALVAIVSGSMDEALCFLAREKVPEKALA